MYNSKLIKRDKINIQSWNSCISQTPNASIYAYSWYLDVVSPDWKALVFGDYVAVFPLTCKTKFGIKYLIKPYFTQQHGLYGKAVTKEMLESVLEEFKKYYRFADIRIGTLDNFAIPGLLEVNNTNYELDLSTSYEELFRNFSQNNKKNIKSSRNKGLRIEEGLSADEFVRFTKQNLSGKINQIPEVHWKILIELIEAVNKNANSKIISVYQGSELCASAFLPYFNKRWYLLVNSSTETGRKNRALYFLLDSFIKEQSSKEQVLDFEGSNIESVAYFFSGFGAKKTTYCSLRYNNLPAILKWLKR